MRCLTKSEIHKWLAGQGMHHQPLDRGVPVAGEFPLPSGQQPRLDLAAYLADLLAKDGNKLIEILPSPDAAAAGSQPGHLFKGGDREAFREMLADLLDRPDGHAFYVYTAPSRTTLLINGRLEVWSPKKGTRNELGRYLTTPRAA